MRKSIHIQLIHVGIWKCEDWRPNGWPLIPKSQQTNKWSPWFTLVPLKMSDIFNLFIFSDHVCFSCHQGCYFRIDLVWLVTYNSPIITTAVPCCKKTWRNSSLGYFQDSIPGYPHLYHPLCLNLGNVYIIKLAPWYTREEYRTKHLSHQRKGRKALFCLYIYINTTFILVLKTCICNRISDVFTNSSVLAIEPWHWILTIFSDSTALHIYILCSTRFQPQQLYTK